MIESGLPASPQANGGASTRRQDAPRCRKPAECGIREGIGNAGIKQRLTELGFELGTVSAAEFDQYQRAEYERWGKVARAAKIRVD
jgi:hypothetical protein